MKETRPIKVNGVPSSNYVGYYIKLEGPRLSVFISVLTKTTHAKCHMRKQPPSLCSECGRIHAHCDGCRKSQRQIQGKIPGKSESIDERGRALMSTGFVEVSSSSSSIIDCHSSLS